MIQLASAFVILASDTPNISVHAALASQVVLAPVQQGGSPTTGQNASGVLRSPASSTHDNPVRALDLLADMASADSNQTHMATNTSGSSNTTTSDQQNNSNNGSAVSATGSPETGAAQSANTAQSGNNNGSQQAPSRPRLIVPQVPQQQQQSNSTANSAPKRKRGAEDSDGKDSEEDGDDQQSGAKKKKKKAKIQDTGNKAECSICYEELEGPRNLRKRSYARIHNKLVTLPCGHETCFDCFKLSGRHVGNFIFDRFLIQNRCFLTFFCFFDQKNRFFPVSTWRPESLKLRREMEPAEL